jgi:hypothetical protein
MLDAVECVATVDETLFWSLVNSVKAKLVESAIDVALELETELVKVELVGAV